jgi:hypothetical protein
MSLLRLVTGRQTCRDDPSSRRKGNIPAPVAKTFVIGEIRMEDDFRFEGFSDTALAAA